MKSAQNPFFSMKQFMIIALVLTFGAAEMVQAQANKKRAQTGMKFLSTSLSAQAVAMGDAVTSIESDGYAIFYNPAGSARTNTRFTLVAGHVGWIADINYSYVGATFRPGDGRYGVFSLHAMTVDYGEIQETIIAGNERGYYDLGLFNPNAVAFGLGYARAITNQFSVGANIKYVNQNLGPATIGIRSDRSLNRSYYSANTIAVDFGVLFKTGFESLNFGMSVRNFSQEVRFDNDGTELPLTFRIGLSMDLLDLVEDVSFGQSLLFSVDANRPRDYDEQLMFGLQYGFMDRFFVRGGYSFPNDEQGFSTGVGINQPFGNRYGLAVDYSYTSFGVFSSVNRFSVRMSF